MLATGPNLIGFLNGATSLVRNGLNNCEGGFGNSRGCARSNDASNPRADGYLDWTPHAQGGTAQGGTAQGNTAQGGTAHAVNASDVIDGLDLLLTGGRLAERSRAVIATAYDEALAASGSRERAITTAQVAETMGP